jgi:hypothetical protein
MQFMTTSNNPKSRDAIIVRTSLIGIGANLFLAAFKAMAGILAGSIAVVLDAVNNLSDAMSSLITIIGTKLASRKPDSKHPYGYGRIEYLSATLISVIVLYAGVTSLVESVKKIINPEVPDYSALSLIIITAGVIVKILLGRYVKSVGEKVNSDSLINSGEDATLDSIISASTPWIFRRHRITSLSSAWIIFPSLSPHRRRICSTVPSPSVVRMITVVITVTKTEAPETKAKRPIPICLSRVATRPIRIKRKRSCAPVRPPSEPRSCCF